MAEALIASLRSWSALSKHGSDIGIHTDAVLAGEDFDALADGVRKLDAQGAHDGGRILRNFFGVTTEIPEAIFGKNMGGKKWGADSGALICYFCHPFFAKEP